MGTNNNTQTVQVRKSRFTTAKGNTVEVFSERAARRRFDGFVGLAEVTRTFALVNGTTEVECEAGCAFQATARVAEAGF